MAIKSSTGICSMKGLKWNLIVYPWDYVYKLLLFEMKIHGTSSLIEILLRWICFNYPGHIWFNILVKIGISDYILTLQLSWF